eukprot:1859463-Pyramimonas_sp.AAC.1
MPLLPQCALRRQGPLAAPLTELQGYPRQVMPRNRGPGSVEIRLGTMGPLSPQQAGLPRRAAAAEVDRAVEIHR